MKKKILLLCFAFFSLFSLQAQNAFFVAGYVTNLNGAAINNHAVYIMSDSSSSVIPVIYATANTNANGYYSFTFTNVPTSGTLVNFHVYTYDCSGNIHVITITNANPQQNVANFSICNGTTNNCHANYSYYSDSATA
ncbi:MAG: hypothetical protein HXX18_03000, partial [Bacteroidetes bacterium]|nr:hypothetical protein [Bacteroidota bacterium]